MPGEPTTTGRFDTPLPDAPERPIREPSDDVGNIIDTNNDATGGNVGAVDIDEADTAPADAA